MESPRETSPSEGIQYASFGDEMDEMIRVAKSMNHLPISDGDGDSERPSSSEGPNDDSEQSGSEGERVQAAKKRRKTAKGTKGALNQQAFACMNGGNGFIPESNPNRRTIEILQEMADYYDRMRDTWRTRAYRMAIGTLKKQTTKISTFDEACELPGIGTRLASKIEEIVLTNRLQRLDNTKLDPSDKVLQQFLKIYGVGVSKAGEWIRAGYKTLDDLKAHATLSTNQQIGIAHYDDFVTRIPREEVTALGKVVQDAAARIDSAVEVIIGGSYRRGAATSGDVDCLITKPGTSSTQQLMRFLSRLVTQLTDDGFFVAALAVPKNIQDDGSKVCQISLSLLSKRV